MFIKKFKYKDHVTGWELEETEFEEINLLVGASGVGKTKILEAITNLRSLALGRINNKFFGIKGMEWNVAFSTKNNESIVWSGQLDSNNQISEDENGNEVEQSHILYENLFVNDRAIINRNGSKVFFLDKETVKLPTSDSAIHLLREEELIKTVRSEIAEINFLAIESIQRTFEAIFGPLLESARKVFGKGEENEYQSIEDIRTSKLYTVEKLFLSRTVAVEVYQKIVDRFCEIFPVVESVKIEKSSYTQPGLTVTTFKDYPAIKIKEQGSDYWVPQEKMSSGMFKTFLHLAEIYLCPDGTVFLIDEFENSLGVNCVQQVMDEILTAGRKIQFIITSHHPYVINNIDFKYWKIVTRKGSLVKTHPSSDYPLGKSRHSAFMQLLQLDEYLTGQES